MTTLFFARQWIDARGITQSRWAFILDEDGGAYVVAGAPVLCSTWDFVSI